jgi:hypothetical protein
MHRRQSKIVAQPFEHRLAQKPVVGQRVFDFGVHDRPDPGRLGFLDWHRKRRFPHDSASSLSRSSRATVSVLAGAGLAGVEHALAVAVADINRGDFAGAGAQLFPRRRRLERYRSWCT